MERRYKLYVHNELPDSFLIDTEGFACDVRYNDCLVVKVFENEIRPWQQSKYTFVLYHPDFKPLERQELPAHVYPIATRLICGCPLTGCRIPSLHD